MVAIGGAIGTGLFLGAGGRLATAGPALIGFDYPVGTYTLASLIVIIPLMVLGWFACRTNIRRIAAERQGYTGLSPVVADRQVTEYFKSR